MDVYVVPLGADHYELYCEVDGDHPEAPTEPPSGWRARLQASFRRVLDFVEGERQKRHAAAAADEPRSRWQRVRDRGIGWMAERIAEQRLLWHLRGQDEAVAHFPADLAPAAAIDIVRRSLQHDADRHWRWMFIDAAGLLLATPLTVLPGPNLPGYFFTFRVVGHFFSWLGARQGLGRVAWHPESSEPLADLRRAAALSGEARDAAVHQVGARLHLAHLHTFVERTLAAGA